MSFLSLPHRTAIYFVDNKSKLYGILIIFRSIAPKIVEPTAIDSLWFSDLEGSIPKILEIMLWTQGILEAPPINSTAWMGITQFLDCIAAIDAAISANTGTIMF